MVILLILLEVILFFISYVHCNDIDSLYGTWSSKSNQVFTGPGFYDPVDELLIEPSLPGISFSFTKNGWFEQATYQVNANPQNPACPQAALTYQHGSFELLSNGSLVLTPIEVDGRQLFSDPCNDNGTSTYFRYSEELLFQWFQVSLNQYHGKYMLQLYQFDGSPMQPLYLAYRPPNMLPTKTLNPTARDDPGVSTGVSGEPVSTSTRTNQKRSLRQMIRRSLENKHKTNAVRREDIYNIDFYWYLSAGLIGIGSLAFFCI